MDYPKEEDLGLLARMALWARVQPEMQAVIWLNDKGEEEEYVTLGEIYHQANAMAHALRNKYDVQPGDRVMLIFTPGTEFGRAFLSCLLAQAVAVPVYPPDPRNPAKGMAKVLSAYESAKPKMAIINGLFATLKRVQEISHPRGPAYPKIPWVIFKGKELEKQVGLYDHTSIPDIMTLKEMDESSNLAFVQFTSGSTGDPKGVMISMINLNANLLAHKDQLGLCRSKDFGCSWLPQYHDMGLVSSLLIGYFCGGTNVHMSPLTFLKNPLLWLKSMSKYKATVCSSPNFAFDLCVREAQKYPEKVPKDLDLSHCETWTNGAEPVKYESLCGFAKQFAFAGFKLESFAPSYGGAENVVMVSVRPGMKATPIRVIHVLSSTLNEGNRIQLVTEKDNFEAKDITELVGCGPPGISVRVVIGVKDKQVHEEGVVGEIWIGGPSRALGYYNNPEATEKAFNSGIIEADENHPEEKAYRSGDLGFIWEGEVYVCGRIKDLIIINGVNVYPQDIENTMYLTDKAHLRGGCQAAFQDKSGNIIVMTEVRPLPKSEQQNMQVHLYNLAERIRTRIVQEHGVNADFVCLLPPRSLPKTTSGKIQRARTRKMFEANELPVQFELSSRAKLGNSDQVDRNAEVPPDLHSEEAAPWLRRKLANILQVSNLDDITEDTDLFELGLSSMQFVAVINVLEDLSRSELTPEFLNSHSCIKDVLEGMRNELSENDRVVFPDVSLPTLPTQRTFRASKCFSWIVQTIGVMAVFGSVMAACLPCYYFGKWSLELYGDESWEFFLLIPLVLPIWMVAYSIIVIVAKWTIIGTYKEGIYSMDSIYFLRWWFVDRLVSMWEHYIGLFIEETLFMNLFYFVLGAKVSFKAAIGNFIREFDLVTVGEHSSVDGTILVRMFSGESRTIRMRKIVIGKRVAIEEFGVVMPGCLVADNAHILPYAALPEGALAKENMMYQKNPAREAGLRDVPNPEEDRAFCVQLWLEICKIIVMIGTLYMFFIAFTPIQFFWYEFNDRPVSDFYYAFPYWVTSVFASALLMVPVAIALKWILLGKVRPGPIPDSWWHDLKVYIVDYQFGVIYATIGILIDDAYALTTLWMKSYGANVDFGVLNNMLPITGPSGLDLLTLERGAFTAGKFMFHTLDGSKYAEIKVSSGAEIGILAVVGAGVVVKENQLVDTVSFVRGKDGGEICEAAREQPLDKNGASLKDKAFGEDESPYSWCWIIFNLVQSAIYQVSLVTGYMLSLLPAYAYAWWILYSSGLGEIESIMAVTGAFPIALIGLELANEVVMTSIHGRDPNTDRFSCSLKSYLFTDHYTFSSAWLMPAIHGTCWLNLWYRLKGAQVGKDVYFNDHSSREFFLHKYGDGAILDEGAWINGHFFRDGGLHVGKVVVDPKAVLHPWGFAIANTVVSGQVMPFNFSSKRLVPEV